MGGWRRRAASLLGLVVIACLAIAGRDAGAQALGVLRITATLDAGKGIARPVPRHALLVSDNPASRAPWRVVTARDGTARVTLPPGNYTVESEEPLVFQGKAYEWRQIVDVVAGSDTALALTGANAEVAASSTDAPPAGTPHRTDYWDLLIQWQDSVLSIWTPTTHASATVISSTGLVATAQRIIGSTTSVEVQFSPTVKVAARVIASDAARDVAILWVDPARLGSRSPLPLRCDGGTRPVLERGQRVSAIGTTRFGQVTTAPGTMRRVMGGVLAAEFDFDLGSPGGPVFSADGAFVGLTSIKGSSDPAIDDDNTAMMSIAAVCDMLATAQTNMKGIAAPTSVLLPVEPVEPTSENVLREAAKRRTGSMTPYKTSSPTFDIAIITPAVAFAGLQESMDFGQWSSYVAEHPAALFVRVTPKQVESLWVKVARGAAMTQGIALPPIKHFTPGFARMRMLCGANEVTPIHPFVIERRVSETDAVREGLHVLPADAIGPHCGTVTLEIYSEKVPDKRESAAIDPKLLAQIWNDMAMFRTTNAQP
jgi:S1-C subfamily serine protease